MDLNYWKGIFFKPRRIYLDYAGATPLLPEARAEMPKTLNIIGNPGAIHKEGVAAKAALDNSREGIARELACKPREVIFTSGGTEANNLAIMGYFKKVAFSGFPITKTHWITSSIEHPSVLECFQEIKRMGGQVTCIDPSADGRIIPERVMGALKKETVFVSIGWANGETGTVQPIREIAEAIRGHEKATGRIVLFHTDASQAPLFLAPNVHMLGVDLMTIDSGKLYGPRGIAALYISARSELEPIVLGGGQERGLRSGTEAVALAAGFAKAFEHISRERKLESERLKKLRDSFAATLEKRIPGTILNTHLKHSLPHVLNVSIPHKQNGEYIALALDARGVSVATKSACREGEGSLSHVVQKLGGEPWRALNTLRFSLGKATTRQNIETVVHYIQEICKGEPT